MFPSSQSVTFRFRNFSVSKLFQFFGWYRIRYRKNLVSKKVSDSVSEKIWYRKKYRIRYRKYLVLKKVSDSLWKKIIKKSWFCRFEPWFSKIWYRYWYRFRNFSSFLAGIGFGIEKIWYRKKYRIRYRKKLVSKKYRIRYLLTLFY